MSTTSLPLRITPGSMSGWRATRILRPPEKTSTVPSSLTPEEGAVGGRRLGELLDLLAQRGQLLLGLLQGEGELLVLGDGLGQLALGLEQPLLEGLDPTGALLEPTAQGGDFFLGLEEPGAQRLELALAIARRPLESAVGLTSPRSPASWSPYRPPRRAVRERGWWPAGARRRSRRGSAFPGVRRRRGGRLQVPVKVVYTPTARRCGPG